MSEEDIAALAYSRWASLHAPAAPAWAGLSDSAQSVWISRVSGIIERVELAPQSPEEWITWETVESVLAKEKP